MIAPEPYRTQIAKYLHHCFNDEHGPSFWEGYTGNADDLWCMLKDAMAAQGPDIPAARGDQQDFKGEE